MALLEYYGFAGRLDFSGNRGGLKRPLSKRDSSFPYDREFPTYGSPQAYDRGSGAGRDAGGHPIVPKDTEHTPWGEDDGLDPEPTDESPRVPPKPWEAGHEGYSVAMVRLQKMATGLGGTTSWTLDPERGVGFVFRTPAAAERFKSQVAGASGPFRLKSSSMRGLKLPDVDEVQAVFVSDPESALARPTSEAMGVPMSIKKAGDAHQGATVPGTSGPWGGDPFDDPRDLQDLLDAEPGDQQVVGKMPVGQFQFGMGAQKKRLNRRESMSRGPWKTLSEAYVSLRGTPEGQMTLSKGVEQAELDALKGEFADAYKSVGDEMTGMDDADVVKVLFVLDPDHAAQNFKQVGKEKLSDIYKSWASDIMPTPDDETIHDGEDDDDEDEA